MSSERKKNDSDKLIKLGKSAKAIILASLFLISFSIFAPVIFVQKEILGLDFSNTGQIGDTISGLMNPFIGIAGVLLTFVAFYIQYKANRLQYNSFREELDEQKEQFKKTQFENQFYEMLRLHKENVNEIEINIIEHNKDGGINDRLISGRNTFEYLIKELEFIYVCSKYKLPDEKIKERFELVYAVFFNGLRKEYKKNNIFFEILAQIKAKHNSLKYRHLMDIVKQHNMFWDYNFQYPILNGYLSQFAHYYRHLFQTVKFVVYQDETLLTYEEKRKYLRILRAQLSNQEQAMLFYNWLSGFGSQWENDTNKFFTDYRMIHNLNQDILIPDIKIDEKFKINGDLKKEKGREHDPLFEYQD